MLVGKSIAVSLMVDQRCVRKPVEMGSATAANGRCSLFLCMVDLSLRDCFHFIVIAFSGFERAGMHACMHSLGLSKSTL